MIKAIVIDDEQHCITRLQTLVSDYCPTAVEILGWANSVEDGLQLIKSKKPELVFLDVQINQSTGFDLLEQFTDISFHIIFTTAYEQYALKAFKFSAADYLLKPIDPDDLLLAINKLESQIYRKSIPQQLEALAFNFKNLNKNHKIAIPTLSGLEFLHVQDIVHCESDINYTTIYMEHNKRLVVAKTLKDFEAMLVSHNFYRVHNSHLVNVVKIKSYNKGKGGWLKMEDGTEIEVSSRRKDGLLNKLTSTFR